jgi:hypothetical protein
MERKRQLELDRETLAKVLPGLERLEAQWNDARLSIAARERGYFTPDEDDHVRQMLLAYRNYRLALYEIIYRSYEYERLPDPSLKLRVFLVGFAAALTLYSKSLKLIAAYEREPLVRQKLDEPDAKFELEAGLFEELLHAYSSPWNYQGLLRAAWFWRRRRRDFQALVNAQPDWQWLVEVILKERVVVRQRLTHILLCRLRYDWRSFARTLLQPVKRTRYSVRSLIGTAGANLRTPGQYVPALTPSVAARLRAQLEPGDVLLVRAEKKLTAAILPGFWAHAALFVGSPSDLEALGLANHPYVRKHWPALAAHDHGQGCVIEALAPQVRFQALQNCLSADHVVVLRPVLPSDQLAAGVAEAFGHLGKPYDFEFDFNISTRIVCTELIYRCYHGRGAITFPLVKRLGRFTLTGDDIATLVSNALSRDSAPDRAPFELIAMALKMGEGEAQFVESEALLATMQKIQAGWRPAKLPEPVHA